MIYKLKIISMLTGIIITVPLTGLIAKPDYASPETSRIIEQMIAAHGGMQKWENAPTVSFDNIFFNPFALEQEGASPWWVSHEVIEQSTRRAYHDWPLDEEQLSYNGEKVWTVNWPIGNPPKFQALFFYYFVGLPWLTQDSNVKLGTPGRGQLPGFDKDYITVTMEYSGDPGIGKTQKDSYKLYIDPDTYLLQGYEYVIGYGQMLELMKIPEGQLIGPMLRIHDKLTEVDGLVVPTKMHTMAPDGSATFGYHVLINYAFDQKFDETRMNPPSDAVVDNSSASR